MKFLLLVMLCCFAAVSHANVFEYPLKDHPAQQKALRELTVKMQQQGEVGGDFVQTKHLQMLARPIITRGKFALTQTRFVWQIEQPFAIRYEFSGQKLLRELDGQSQAVEPSAEPMLYGFFSFFASLFSLSEQSLDKLFVIYYLPSNETNTWVLGLKPRQESIARSLKQLQIYGSATQILKVQLVEQNDDRTELEFSYPAMNAPSAP